MKNAIRNAMVLIVSIVLISATMPAKKQNLHGVWRMVSGKTNGTDNPPITVDRTWEFKKDNTFEGKIFLPDGVKPFNEGIFMLPNDTTMVTIHSRKNGQLDLFPFKYNYEIKNDTLHLYGFYLTASKDVPGLIRPVYIDEIWVKERLE